MKLEPSAALADSGAAAATNAPGRKQPTKPVASDRLLGTGRLGALAVAATATAAAAAAAADEEVARADRATLPAALRGSGRRGTLAE